MATLQLCGGLNHTIFCPLFLLRVGSLFSVSGWNLTLWSNPLLERALLSNSLELLKTVLLDDSLFIRQEILSGRLFLMLGGWLEFTLMYNSLLSGLLYGSCLPVGRFSVKSRKSPTSRFVSLTMLRLNSFLNNSINDFLILSAYGPLVFSKQAKPSSLYKPILFSIFLTKFVYNIKPNYFANFRSVKTAHSDFKVFVTIFFYPLICTAEKKYFLECIMVFVSSSLILTKALAINCFK